jgi:hypothetical protein
MVMSLKTLPHCLREGSEEIGRMKSGMMGWICGMHSTQQRHFMWRSYCGFLLILVAVVCHSTSTLMTVNFIV